MTTLRRYLPVVLVVIAGCLLSVVSFGVVETIENNRAEAYFNRAASDRIFAVRRSIHANIDVVESIAAFLAASGDADREAFDVFATALLARHESVQAFEWIPRVPAADRTAYETAAREDGFPGFRISEREMQGRMVPAAERDEYFPVYFLTPYRGNEIALGFDLGSNATRLAALNSSRDSGELVVSGRITLVQESGTQNGFLAFAPVFRAGLPHDTIEQRRRNLLGFALGVYRMGDIVTGAYNASGAKGLEHPAGIDLYLYDLNGDADARLLHVHSSRRRSANAPMLDEREARSGPHVAETIDVAGREWLIVARPVDTDLGVSAVWQPWAAAFTVLAFTAVLVAYLVASLNRARAVEAQVDERTLELRRLNERLRESEARASAVVDNIVDGIITIDEHGAIQSFNPAAETIFGFAADEVMGRNVKILMPEPDHGAHDGYLRDYLTTGEAKIIGIGREVVGRRKDGTTFPLDLAISEAQLGDGRLFTGIVRDITERKEIDRMKNEFISTVSHELRTPLTSIMGSLGLVRGGALGEFPEKARGLLDIAYNNSDRLVRLINDILDIEKIESGKLDDPDETVDIMPLVEAALDANTGLCDQYRVSFTLSERLDGARVIANRDRLMQVLTNLLSNAVKFSPPGGCVEIAVSREGDNLRIAVTDRGPGIPDEFHDRIFQKFAQADSSDDRQRGGTGLGLSICKAIVERYGGTIGFETEMHRGTTFHFTLPAIDEEPLPALEADGGGQRVLVCEDDSDIARLLAIMIENEGYRPDIAYSAAEAKAMLAENDYAAMTLDLVLPDQDGIALIRELRASPATQSLPIIVVSVEAARGAQGINGDAIRVIDWMGKPIDQARLSANLRLAMRAHRNGKPRILHVEDDADIVKVVAMIIGDDAKVVVARTLGDARTMLEREVFDLVVLDLILPDGSGEALLPLLNRPGGPVVPVIIFSVKDVTRATAERVAAVLVKARTTNELLADTIRSYIAAACPPNAS